ncbi:leucine-rich repeat domain-containing protein [Microcoleus sp. LEGE 07076]|uniref:leucine-rich repeat domain-containing protein n=1 Tax=Microcoleus sp. LEGE 07076 TaxID=915322 RepID=UPI001D148B7F|nr:leucine-rich repeat domain-containing protein [Microcoleus sp. LEGE 07076]
MTLIVAQKYINLQRSIALACCCALIALSGNGVSAKAAEVRSSKSRRTFADWCRQKASLSPEAKHTVEVLLEKAGTTECDAANRQLSSLTTLSLSLNRINDIKPVASLTNLSELVLIENQVSDIKPLASLTNLNWLDLDKNQIRDIKPLASLTNLMELSLDNNQISDIKLLNSLTNLIWFSLSGNPIAPKTCPLKPESICKWEAPTETPIDIRLGVPLFPGGGPIFAPEFSR